MPETWSALTEGRAGITPISFFDATGYPSSIAGEAQDFDPLVRLSSKDARKMDRFVQLGMVAGLEAYADAGLNGGLDKDRFGILIGAGIGGLETIEKTTSTLLERDPEGFLHSIFPAVSSIWSPEIYPLCWMRKVQIWPLQQPVQPELIA